MVCLGNICRSPLAEGILRSKTAHLAIEVDSAGTAAYHEGERPDPRSIQVARKYGVDISYQRARPFSVSDFDEFDHIYAMDRQNYMDIISMARNADDENKVEMILNLTYPESNESVPDPYYGGDAGFENVYQMLDEACDALLKSLD